MAKVFRHVVLVMKRGNPAYAKPAEQITDRAKRYRAHHPDVTPGPPKQCGFCGSRRNVVPHHITGNEADGEKQNLMWACKSCNGAVAHVMRKNGLGKKTRQFNPAKKRGRISGTEAQLRAYNFAILVMRGKAEGDVQKAMQTIYSTPASVRSTYTKRSWPTRKERYGPSGRQGGLFDEVPF